MDVTAICGHELELLGFLNTITACALLPTISLASLADCNMRPGNWPCTHTVSRSVIRSSGLVLVQGHTMHVAYQLSLLPLFLATVQMIKPLAEDQGIYKGGQSSRSSAFPSGITQLTSHFQASLPKITYLHLKYIPPSNYYHGPNRDDSKCHSIYPSPDGHTPKQPGFNIVRAHQVGTCPTAH